MPAELCAASILHSSPGPGPCFTSARMDVKTRIAMSTCSAPSSPLARSSHAASISGCLTRPALHRAVASAPSSPLVRAFQTSRLATFATQFHANAKGQRRRSPFPRRSVGRSSLSRSLFLGLRPAFAPSGIEGCPISEASDSSHGFIDSVRASLALRRLQGAVQAVRRAVRPRDFAAAGVAVEGKSRQIYVKKAIKKKKRQLYDTSPLLERAIGAGPDARKLLTLAVQSTAVEPDLKFSTSQEELENAEVAAKLSQGNSLDGTNVFGIGSQAVKSILMLNALAALNGSTDAAIHCFDDALAGHSIPPSFMVSCRFLMATVSLLPFLLKAELPDGLLASGAQLGTLLFCGIFSQSMSTKGVDTMIGYRLGMTAVVMLLLETGILNKENQLSSNSKFSAGVALAMMFALVVAVHGQTPFDTSDLPHFLASVGASVSSDTWSLLASLFCAVHTFRCEAIMRSFPGPSNAIMMTALQLGMVTALAMGWQGVHLAGIADGAVGSWSAALAQMGDQFSSLPLIPFLYLGFVSTGACVFLETKALQRVKASTVTLIYTTIPLWGALFHFGVQRDLMSMELCLLLLLLYGNLLNGITMMRYLGNFGGSANGYLQGLAGWSRRVFGRGQANDKGNSQGAAGGPSSQAVKAQGVPGGNARKAGKAGGADKRGDTSPAPPAGSGESFLDGVTTAFVTSQLKMAQYGRMVQQMVMGGKVATNVAGVGAAGGSLVASSVTGTSASTVAAVGAGAGTGVAAGATAASAAMGAGATGAGTVAAAASGTAASSVGAATASAAAAAAVEPTVHLTAGVAASIAPAAPVMAGVGASAITTAPVVAGAAGSVTAVVPISAGFAASATTAIPVTVVAAATPMTVTVASGTATAPIAAGVAASAVPVAAPIVAGASVSASISVAAGTTAAPAVLGVTASPLATEAAAAAAAAGSNLSNSAMSAASLLTRAGPAMVADATSVATSAVGSNVTAVAADIVAADLAAATTTVVNIATSTAPATGGVDVAAIAGSAVAAGGAAAARLASSMAAVRGGEAAVAAMGTTAMRTGTAMAPDMGFAIPVSASALSAMDGFGFANMAAATTSVPPHLASVSSGANVAAVLTCAVPGNFSNISWDAMSSTASQAAASATPMLSSCVGPPLGMDALCKGLTGGAAALSVIGSGSSLPDVQAALAPYDGVPPMAVETVTLKPSRAEEALWKEVLDAPPVSGGNDAVFLLMK